MSSEQTAADLGRVPAFLRGGGEAGARLRSIDWSKSALGPVASWPPSLRAAVGTLLHSRHPMFLWWGPELIQFYNDAYLPSLGMGRSEPMGQRGAEYWRDTWATTGPQIDDVMQRGISSWHEDQLVPLWRHDRLDETYWTYSYSPVYDDAGEIGGTLAVCAETTSRVLSERRARTMRALSEATSLATYTSTMLDRAAESLVAADKDLPFFLLYELVCEGGDPVLRHAIGVDQETARAIDAHLRHELGDLTEPRSLPEALGVITKTWPEAVRRVFVAPMRIGPESATGYVLCGLSPRLSFDAAYRAHLEDIGGELAQAEARISAFRVKAIVEHERYNLLQQAPVPTALMLGPQLAFQLANRLFTELVGRQVVGRSFREAFPELVDTPVAGLLAHAFEQGTSIAVDEMMVPLTRPEVRSPEPYFKFNIEPMKNALGDTYGLMVVGVEISAEVASRRKLERSQVEREGLVRELERASRAKDEFLAMLGHELRNPLSPILTALQLMRLRGLTGAEKEREIIERQVRHMVGLVDDLLDVSRITRGMIQLKRDRWPLPDIITEAIEQASPLIERLHHRLRVDVLPELVIDGDRGRLAQVIANLLTNAAKYTPPGGHIWLRGERHGDQAWITVRDDGIGISPETMPSIFDPFAQERQRSDRSQGGLGLGLAIVKSLVEAHGGTVEIHSEGTGRGTECVVKLPLATTASYAQFVESKAPIAPLAGHRVLLVDDNAEAAELLAEALRELGHEVQVAFDGPSALELAGRSTADVALLDLGLPVIDGYELAARLRQQRGWERVRLAALTGYGAQHDREQTAAAGFAAHLVKPIDLEEVDAAVRRLGAPA